MKYLDNEATVLMVQFTKAKWRITTRSGFVLMDDIPAGNKAAAEDFIKRYISTWPAWHYKIITLEDQKGGKK